MKQKDFIVKAEKGGWDIEGLIAKRGFEQWWRYDVNEKYITVRTGSSTIQRIPSELVLLEPEAWQAVGKVEGWEVSQWKYKETHPELPDDYQRLTWQNLMREMIDALIAGKTIEEYLATL